MSAQLYGEVLEGVKMSRVTELPITFADSRRNYIKCLPTSMAGSLLLPLSGNCRGWIVHVRSGAPFSQDRPSCQLRRNAPNDVVTAI